MDVSTNTRMGVRRRLFGVIMLNGLLALGIGVGAMSAFGTLRQGITEVTSRLFPGVVASARLERQHQRIMRTIEQLAVAPSDLIRETIDQAMSDQFSTYALMLDELSTSPVSDPRRLGELNGLHQEIIRLKGQIDHSAGQRLRARKLLLSQDQVIERVAQHLRVLGARPDTGVPVQRWLAVANGLMVLAGSVNWIDHSRGIAGLSREAAVEVLRMQDVFRALPAPLRVQLAPLQDDLLSLTTGTESIFSQRTRYLEASEGIGGLLDRASQVSLATTGLNTGISVVQTNRAEERRQDVIESADSSTHLFLGAAAIVVLSSGGALFYVQRKVVGRLLDVRQALRARLDGDLVPIPVDGQDEITELARALEYFIRETEIKSAELRRSEQWLRTLLEVAPVPLLIVGRDDGVIRYVNDRAAAAFGARDDLLGASMGALWVSRELQDDFRQVVDTFGIAREHEAELTGQQGRVFWGLMSGARFHFNDEDVLLISAVDISQRKRAEAQLRRTQVFLDAVIENIPSGLIVLDRAGDTVRLWNHAAEQMFGLRREDVLRRPLRPLAGTDLGPALTVSPSPSEHEVSLALGGQDRIFRLQILDFEGMAEGAIQRLCIADDVTARRQAETMLRAAKDAAERADTAKTEFLATVSHEMRTPLNGILGLGRLLAQGRLSQEQRRRVHSILQCGSSLLRHVNDILDMRKIEDGKLDLTAVPCRIDALVDDARVTVDALAAEKGLRLDTVLAADLPAAAVLDPHWVRQVLINLLGNAVKFTPSGWVRLSVDAVAGADGAALLCFTVADSGIGIAPDRHAAIFEKLQQADASIARRFGGSGLGLAIVRKLMDHMGGTIRLDSAPGQGSVFRVLLPLRPAEGPVETALTLPAPQILDRSLSLLLVEDDPVNREVAVGLLCDHAILTEASNGHDALVLAASRDFDAILLDIRLPDMDGRDVVRKIRALADPRRAAVPVIAVTANVFGGDRESYILAGMNGVLEKPVFAEALFEMLAPFAGRRRGAPDMDASAPPLAAAEEGASDEVLNLTRLRVHVDKMGPERFVSTLRRLDENLDELLPVFAQSQADPAVLMHAAHRLAGTFSHFGLDEAVAWMRDLENALEHGQDLGTNAQDALPLCARARTALARWCRDNGFAEVFQERRVAP